MTNYFSKAFALTMVNGGIDMVIAQTKSKKEKRWLKNYKKYINTQPCDIEFLSNLSTLTILSECESLNLLQYVILKEDELIKQDLRKMAEQKVEPKKVVAPKPTQEVHNETTSTKKVSKSKRKD